MNLKEQNLEDCVFGDLGTGSGMLLAGLLFLGAKY